MSAMKRKRWLPLLCMSMLLAGSLAGCSGNNAANSKDTAGDKAAGEATANTASNSENAYKDKYDPEVTFTTAWGVDPELKFKNGESIENNVATKWAKEKFGINIKSLWSITDTNGAFGTKLRLSMSSGQDMPDVVTIGTADNTIAQDLIDSGMYADVGTLFDKYASDTWKEAMAQDLTFGTNTAVMAKEWACLFSIMHITMITFCGSAKIGWIS